MDKTDQNNSSSESKKNNFLSLKNKSEILNRLSGGTKARDLAEEYGVARSTISRLKKNRKAILEAMTTTYKFNENRRSLRSTFFPKMESALYQWYIDQCKQNVAINGTMLRVQARHYYTQFRENDLSFRASSGWMDKFQKRYGIRLSGARTSGKPLDQPIEKASDPEGLLVVKKDNVVYDDYDYEDEKDNDEKDECIVENIKLEPAFINVDDKEFNHFENCEVAQELNIAAKSANNTPKIVPPKTTVQCLDKVIRWSIENNIESLYLTMLRSLRERVTASLRKNQ